MKASVMIKRLEKMMTNKGDVEVVILDSSGSHGIKRVDSANEGMTGEGIIFIEPEKEYILSPEDIGRIDQAMVWGEFYTTDKCVKMEREGKCKSECECYNACSFYEDN